MDNASKPVSMPWWHRRVPEPPAPKHQHQWERIDTYEVTDRNGRKIGVYYVCKCTACGEIKQFNTGLQYFRS